MNDRATNLGCRPNRARARMKWKFQSNSSRRRIAFAKNTDALGREMVLIKKQRHT